MTGTSFKNSIKFAHDNITVTAPHPICFAVNSSFTGSRKNMTLMHNESL